MSAMLIIELDDIGMEELLDVGIDMPDIDEAGEADIAIDIVADELPVDMLSMFV